MRFAHGMWFAYKPEKKTVTRETKLATFTLFFAPGLAIGVEMVGQGVVTLVDHEEDYVITFPKCYGR